MAKVKIDNKKNKKTFTGIVVSLKMQNTAVVEVQREVIHPLYKKVLRRSKRIKADTNSLELSLGDQVKIIETRPVSKNKYFRIVPQDKKVERRIN